MADKQRRSKGDGSLFKRSDGYWVGGVELPPGRNGQRRMKRIVRKDRNQCLEELRKLRAEVAAGQVPTSGSTTVGRWLDFWFEDVLPHRKVVPDTMDSYERTIRLYLKPGIGALRLDRLEPSDLRSLYRNLEREVSGRATQKADQVMRLAVKAAIREGLIASNVMERVDKPAYTPSEAASFDAATSLFLIETAVKTQGPVWGARWALGFTTGARESELLGLEWDRVNLEAGTIDISWQLKRLKKRHGCGSPLKGKYPCGKVRMSFCPDAEWAIPAWMEWRHCVGTLGWTRPKTKAGTRIVPVIPQMLEILGRLPADDNPHGLVFHQPDGRPFSQETDQEMWKQLLEAAGIPHVRQHSIRYSTATLLLEAGVDAHVIQQVIGHADIAMTRAYQHVNLELARRAWGNLAAIMPTV